MTDQSEFRTEHGFRHRWMEALLFLAQVVKVPSKELPEPGPITLYDAQLRFLHEVDEGLAMGQHFFTVLKSRQLGISTIMLLMDIMWLWLKRGLQGALIADEEKNIITFRETIEMMLESAPPKFRIPIKRSNKNALILDNGSRLQYLVAGKRKNPDLGRSKGFNFVHASEVSGYGDQEGIASLVDALATDNPNRLYIFESTAKGFNAFYDMVLDAMKDPTKRAIFIGWWAKSLNQISRTMSVNGVQRPNPIFQQHWELRPLLDEQEQAMAYLIEKDYGVVLTPEQWAWWRNQLTKRSEHNLLQEHPWHANVAFQVTGSAFFQPKKLAADMAALRNPEAPVTFSGYRYEVGSKYFETRCVKVDDASLADLKVWEPPVKHGRYAIGADVAYGRSATNDRHSIQVYRCYADKVVQVAEWTTSVPETRVVAWVLAHLASNYRDCMINLEVNGPGLQVMNEMQSLRQDLQRAGLHGFEALTQENGKPAFDHRNALDNMRWYLYHRPDTPSGGYMYNWKCLSLDTRLPTPTGWTTMGDVEAGDFLLGRDGKPTKVLGVSPVKQGARCYRVTFGDGTAIIADEEHLWQVYRPHWAHQERSRVAGIEKIRATVDLMPGKHVIKRAAALELPPADLPIDPYVLGVWLGDGMSAQGLFFASEADMPEMSRLLQEAGEDLGPVSQDRTVQRRPIRGLTARLSSAGLLRNKHIPAAYLRASREQRLSLLQGLMDTDGTCSIRHGQCEFTTSNPALADGVKELLRTLGYSVTVLMRQRSETSAPACQISFKAHADVPVFRLPRKRALLADPALRRQRHHQIVSVTEVESVPVRCVLVDSDDHLFLAGEGMIPTHNTNSDNKQEMLNGFRDIYSTDQLIIRSLSLLDEMKDMIQSGISINARQGKKDDRVFASGLAVHAWKQWIRLPMMNEGRMWSVEQRKDQMLLAAEGRVQDTIVAQHFRAMAQQRHQEHLDRLLNGY